MSSSTGRTWGVTERELGVLDLVAGHLTNAEIAERLVLSVRTVESHVSSLIRKLEVSDRRALARRAADLGLRGRSGRRWPSPADPFVGRRAETAALRTLLRQHRVVTVAGPGGAGKTRLVVHAVGLGVEDHPDGAWFVDLTQVATASEVVSAIADVVGVAPPPGRPVLGALLEALSDVDALLVLDNCEHLLPDLEPVVARLVTASSRLRVVATSRAPLRAPYEWVYELPPLESSDAVDLFRARAESAGGGTVLDGPAVQRLCDRLEGMALAVELAAARYPVLGLDGLRAALDDPLRLLSSEGGPRQRSLRATLAWSVDLLDDEAREVLETVFAFAAPFTASSAAALLAPRLAAAGVTAALARLADQHLLRAQPGSPTRYGLQEVVRHFAATSARDPAAALASHRAWSAAELQRLASSREDSGWAARLDELAVEVRAALARSDDGGELTERLAEQLVVRGHLEEAQQRFEAAAATPGTEARDRVRLLRLAAGAAAARLGGDDLIRLLDEAAAVARGDGDHDGAADALGWSVIFAAFHPGTMAHPPGREEVERRLAEARALAPHGSAAAITVAVADAGLLPGADPLTVVEGRRVAALAADAGLPVLASAALDGVCSSLLSQGEHAAALATVRERGDLMDPLPLTAATAYPFNDYLLMGCEISLSAGALDGAREYAERLASLPCYVDYAHPALARRVQVDLLTGDLAAAVRHGQQLLLSWDRSGRQRAGTMAVAACAVATAHGLLGDAEGHRAWTTVTAELLGEPHPPSYSYDVGWAPTLDGWLLLHRGSPDLALERLAAGFDDLRWAASTTALLWRPWYAAAWAEACAISAPSELEHHLTAVERATHQNPVAVVLVQRAQALARGARDDVAGTAPALEGLGSCYQRDRSLVLATRTPST